MAAATERQRLIKVKRLRSVIQEHGPMNTRSTFSSGSHRLIAVVAWTLGAVGAYFLATRHFDHVVQAAPYLVLLACPLMHLFGHRHGKHQHGSHPPGDGRDDAPGRGSERSGP